MAIIGGVIQALLNQIQNQQIGQLPGSQGVPTSVATSLANVAIPAGVDLSREGSFKDVDALIQARTDPALDILRAGSDEAVRLSQLGQREGTESLERFADLAAFEEQASLLGLRGEEAQGAAIAGIPVSEFDRELQRRQQQQLLRGAAARGEVGGGATIVAGQQLAGGQQAEIIQRRLAELEPLVAAARSVRSTQAGIDEAARARQAQLQFGLGAQESNIRFGTTAPLIESRLQQAELSGLRGISRAQQQGQIATQLAGLAGQFAPQIESFFTPSFNPNNPALQTNTPTGFVPEAGVVAVA